MKRVRGLAPWRPQAKTLRLIASIQTTLVEYETYLPLSIRQVFYRLVGNYGFEKTEPAYKRLCETANRARRAGLIPFEAIRDDGVSEKRPSFWDGPDDFTYSFLAAARQYRLDRQTDQPVRLWLLCEAGGMAPMLARAVRDFGIPVLSCGGFDSLTAKYDLARELVGWGGPTEVLHIGDYDPSGVHLFNALAEDVGQIAADLGSRNIPTFTRLAVTPAQIDTMSLPTAPPKKTGNRAFDDTRTVQAEAIPPNDLTQIAVEAIRSRQDYETRLRTLDVEESQRNEIIDWMEARQ